MRNPDLRCAGVVPGPEIGSDGFIALSCAVTVTSLAAVSAAPVPITALVPRVSDCMCTAAPRLNVPVAAENAPAIVVDDYDAARERARAEGKLLFVLHVSGNFEDPQFT